MINSFYLAQTDLQQISKTRHSYIYNHETCLLNRSKALMHQIKMKSAELWTAKETALSTENLASASSPPSSYFTARSHCSSIESLVTATSDVLVSCQSASASLKTAASTSFPFLESAEDTSLHPGPALSASSLELKMVDVQKGNAADLEEYQPLTGTSSAPGFARNLRD